MAKNMDERVLKYVGERPGVPRRQVTQNIRPHGPARQAVYDLCDEGLISALRRRHAGSSLFLFLTPDGAEMAGFPTPRIPNHFYSPDEDQSLKKAKQGQAVERAEWLKREEAVLRAILDLLRAGMHGADYRELLERMRTLSEACGWYDRTELEVAMRKYLGVRL